MRGPGLRVLATPQTLASDDTIWLGVMYPTSAPLALDRRRPTLEAVDPP